MAELVWQDGIGAGGAQDDFSNKLLFLFVMIIFLLMLIFPEIKTGGRFLPISELLLIFILGGVAFIYWARKKHFSVSVFEDGVSIGNQFIPKKDIRWMTAKVGMGRASAIVEIADSKCVHKSEIIKFDEFFGALEGIGIRVRSCRNLKAGNNCLLFKKRIGADK
ncbi:MAG: hypothetical protein V1835_07265 [Candidatus Micrarchaeota archaeon]